MKEFDIYWQDAVAAVAGTWLTLVLGLEYLEMTVAEGWIAYVGGALAVMFAAAGFTSKHPNYSWAAAVAGIIALLAPFVLGFADSTLVLVSMVAGGGVVAAMSIWSALIKKNARSAA